MHSDVRRRLKSDAGRHVLSARKPHGHFERTGPYGELETGDTLSCCHCRKHWEVRAGSGTVRGFCRQCMGYTCGHSDCDSCVPFELRLENIEHGLDPLTPYAQWVLVPGSVVTPSLFFNTGE